MQLFFPGNLAWGVFWIGVFVILSILSGKIDVKGSVIGGIIALGMFLGGGFEILLLLLVFFVLGSFVSHWKKKEKSSLGLAQENQGKRSVRHAISNGGIAGLCGFLAWAFPEMEMMFIWGVAGSIAGATADTFSSELGNVYGSSYINILSLKQDVRGKDGVISLEGTAFGLLGSLIISVIVYLTHSNILFSIAVLICGNLANIIDSVLGASLQQQQLLSNDTVNFFSTVFAAVFMMGFWMISI